MDNRATLWLIDDDPALRLILTDSFSEAGLKVIVFTNAQGAWTKLNDIQNNQCQNNDLPDVILTDIRMPMMDGLSFSEWVHQHFPKLPIIIMTAHSDLQSAVDSYQTGAFDYLPKPFDLDEATAIIYKAINKNKSLEKQQQSIKHTKKQQTTSDTNNSTTNIDTNTTGIIGQSPAMQTVFRAIGRLSHTAISVLITGESGTGKELIAHAIHQNSPRKQKPLIALNMAAIPHDLIESELFGHEKGAFTGATQQRQGHFEQAHQGTLFLDEIGDMPYSTQTRLLRVLANGEFFRVGGQKPIKVDVRIIAATHQNLEQLVKQGKFREDLFYRLNVIQLPLPPLRERPDDIPLLIEHFLQKSAKEMQCQPKQVSDEAMAIMQTFLWSGNVRQLENACRWITVMATGSTVFIEDLPTELLNFYQQQKHPLSPPITNHEYIHTPSYQNPQPSSDTTWQQALEQWVEQSLKQGQNDIAQIATKALEATLINTTLTYTQGHKIETAKRLGWGRNTLTRKLKQMKKG